MAFSFDTAVSKLDNVQNAIYGVNVLVDGKPYRGIFDETPDQFEGVDVMYRTIEFEMSEIASLTIENDTTVIELVDEARSFTVYRHEQVDSRLIVELR